MKSKHLKFVRELESMFAGKTKRSRMVGLINKYIHDQRFTEDDFIECFDVCVEKLPDFVTMDFLLNRVHHSKLKNKPHRNELHSFKKKCEIPS